MDAIVSNPVQEWLSLGATVATLLIIPLGIWMIVRMDGIAREFRDGLSALRKDLMKKIDSLQTQVSNNRVEAVRDSYADDTEQ